MPELIISGKPGLSTVLDVYTYVDGHPKQLCVARERVRLDLLPGNVLRVSGSSGASDQSYEYCIVKESELQFVEGYYSVTDSDVHGFTNFYHTSVPAKIKPDPYPTTRFGDCTQWDYSIPREQADPFFQEELSLAITPVITIIS